MQKEDFQSFSFSYTCYHYLSFLFGNAHQLNTEKTKGAIHMATNPGAVPFNSIIFQPDPIMKIGIPNSRAINKQPKGTKHLHLNKIKR